MHLQLRLRLLLVTLSGLVAGCGGHRPGPDIILMTLDTTRADHLGCYGYSRPTSPNLDRLARDGALFTHAYSTASWTLPAHASLFTGKFPTSHGAQYDPEGPLRLTQGISGPAVWDGYRARNLSVDQITLAEILDQAGYRTGAVVGGPWMKRVFGLDKGFEHYDDTGIDTVAGRRADDVTRAALDWIDEDPGAPFFLFLNYYDPHGPFDPPAEYREAFFPAGVAFDDLKETEKLNALYDSEILFMDHHIGILLEGLSSRGLRPGTLILITADHGELLGEKGKFGHGHSLTEAEIRIPLILSDSGPSPLRGEIPAPVQVTGILPLIAGRLGLEVPPHVQGTALPHPSPTVFAEVHPLPATGMPAWEAIVRDGYKYARNRLGERMLIDVDSDPGEARNLLTEDPERARSLASALERFAAGLPRAPKAGGPARTIDGETQEALRRMGYLKQE